jgi:hypothetical protein
MKRALVPMLFMRQRGSQATRRNSEKLTVHTSHTTTSALFLTDFR